MKKTSESEKGYALLVVLFLIVFIFTVSAVFIRGSMSNAMQEHKVDQNHLAVVAAEMGVEYHVGHVSNQERTIQREVLNIIREDIEKLNFCGGSINLEIPGCQNIDSIEDVLSTAKTKYIEGFESLVVDIKKSSPTYVKYSSESYDMNDSPYSYVIDKDEVSLQVKDGKVEFRIGVIGKSHAEKPKLLKSKLSFEIPKFVIRKNIEREATVVNPVSIYEFFKNNSDYEKKVGCSAKNGDCSSGKYYSENSATVNNPNNQGGLIWVHNGLLKVGQMNKFNFTLIVDSLVVGNMNNMNGKLVLLGSENQKGKITLEKNNPQLGFLNNGRLCINIDGYSKSDIEKIPITTQDLAQANHVYFYSAKENPVWPSNAINGHKVSGSLVDFVNICIGQPIIEDDLSGTVQYEVFESDLDILVDVEY